MAQVSCGVVSSWTRLSFGRGRASEESTVTAVGPSWSSRPRAPRRGVQDPGGAGGRLGRYRLIERVGRGRQADVWRAVRDGSGVEQVALKVLPASQRDPKRRAQLRHEAERGTRLSGPSLLPTYDFGEADGAVFMAMPLVVGCTLAEVLTQRRADFGGRDPLGAHRLAVADDRSYTRDVVGLIARVARAAGMAHDERVAHRDIKPGNILVRWDHAEGVFLCDFGLARDLDVATPRQLRDGAGSPQYMAPERLLRRPADEVSGDVFALGVTLFEALTLRPPVDVPDGLPRPFWAEFLATASPRRPSSLWPSIPTALEATALRAMSRDPARRHPTADHFAGDLERFLSDAGRRARRPIFGGR
ncbi:MAG: serine/threonine protein kinase [Planctomycetia bacterium]|nr:serine/threonine protein kinase [Planctomycetia bacterium]